MQLSLCTISFRHHLTSITDIARFAKRADFDAIELWGIHALNLSHQPQFNGQWLSEFDLNVSMLSDYLSTDGDLQNSLDKLERLTELAWRWKCQKIRTFAGHKASHLVSEYEYQLYVEQLISLTERAAKQGCQLVIETHPNTLADNTTATLRLINSVNHPALKVNFDVLHLWEAGEYPAQSWQQLKSHSCHLHLKNISSMSQLNVFLPHNVYASSGSREGMVPLFEGAFDYQQFLNQLGDDTSLAMSLEWFGHNVESVLQNDCRQLKRLFALKQDAANHSPITKKQHATA